MNLTVLARQIQSVAADAVALGLPEGGALDATAGAVDKALMQGGQRTGRGAISRLIELGDFGGRLNETAVLYTGGLIPAPRVILVGLGKPGELDAESIRQAAGTLARRARDLGCRSMAAAVFGAGAGSLDARRAAQAMAEGALMGAYRYREFKTADDGAGHKNLDEWAIVASDAAAAPALAEGARAGEAIAQGVNAARTLINRPGNVATPEALAGHARRMAERAGLRCEVLGEAEIAELGMGGLLAVSQGSAHPPRFVILEHAGADADTGAGAAPLVFIGKGVTFDSGGLSLKDRQAMETMKADMSGAAAVLGALQAIAELRLPARVIGLLPLAENMPGGRAARPGDVITMMSGLTVEMISTDAEGRLLLADALHYARRYEPRGVVDVATLTGACAVALGEGVAAGLFANREGWARQVLSASEAAGERLWRLPLYPEYGEKIKSEVADLKNSSGRAGGVGASAWFLKRFVSGAYAWAHIDMAGMMFNAETRGCQPKGASGYGARTLVALAGAV
jgi:leucyl aminopeptidase